MIISAFGFLIIGFILIVIAANELVNTSAHIAASFNISPLLIGLTIVALGTSAPEIFVTITAALNNKSGLAIGNAIGSNIANIGLVLGLTGLLKPIKLQSEAVFKELPILFIIMIVSHTLLIDNYFSMFDGFLLLLGLTLLITYLYFIAQQNRQDPIVLEVENELKLPCRAPYPRLLFSLILLPISAKIIIDSGVKIAIYYGMSEVVVGLTIIAIGTSLPEIVTSIVGIIKGEDDIAIGNIIGSNMFNILAVLPLCGLLAPTFVPNVINLRDIPVMFILSTVFVFIVYFSGKTINRISSAILITIYFCYLFILLSSA